MSTPVFVVLFVLFVSAALLMFINLTGDPGIDYWDLDGDSRPPASKLDVLRGKPVLFGAGAVLVVSYVVYLLVRR